MERELGTALARWRISPSAWLADHIDDLSELRLELPSWSMPQIGERLDALAALPADPRITQGLRRWLLCAVPHASARHVWRRILYTVARVGDVRAHVWLPMVAEEAWGTRTQQRWLRTLARELSGAARVKPAALRPVCFAVVPGAPEFDSDTSRRVWADRLLEAGDPRGELICLQLCDAPTPQQRQRIAELVARYGRLLAGEIAPALRPDALLFERGYLAQACIANAWALASFTGHPDWGTVRSIDLRHVRPTPAIGAFLTHPCLKSLERVHQLSLQNFLYLLRETRTVQARELHLIGRLAPALLEAVQLNPAFDRVEAVVVNGRRWELEEKKGTGYFSRSRSGPCAAARGEK